MAKDSDRQMTIPELLEARAKVRERLEAGTGGTALFPPSPDNVSAQEELLAALQEIETELAERGYKEA